MGILNDLLKSAVGAAASSMADKMGVDIDASPAEMSRKIIELCRILSRARSEEVVRMQKEQVKIYYNILKTKAMSGDRMAIMHFDRINSNEHIKNILCEHNII